jgi:predicted AAA+ superfamily ATPase
MIMYRDVVERNRLGNTFLLKYLLKYCFVNLSTSLSLNKLFNDFRSQGLQLSKNTLYDYVSFLEDAYAIFTVPVHAVSLKETFRNPKKLYSIDHGFKRVFDLPPSTDIGRIYENIVFLELKRAGKNIYYVKGKREVDFYCPGEDPSLINVCYDIENPATRSREVKGLSEAMRTLKIDESTLITADREETIQTEQGRIRVIPLWKWLLADE